MQLPKPGAPGSAHGTDADFVAKLDKLLDVRLGEVQEPVHENARMETSALFERPEPGTLLRAHL